MGFTLISRRPLEELDAVLWELRHDGTGARLVWLDRAEENKTFCIGFPTRPWDNTGVFHILEHSVLCGSGRYPVREPFVELMKTSLSTFLNAITFPDKTLYPVSSRSEQDLHNLMRVYLDAVFHPLLLQTPQIFAQEGWHYEVDAHRNVTCKGVVFNEMKGAFSSPDTLLEYEMNRRLFPDTCYRWVAGGDPEHIPDLTWEAFAAAHRKWYHPSQALIVLDGALDLDGALKILDEEFLSAYDRRPPLPPLAMQAPVDGGTAVLDYGLSAREPLEGRCWLGLGFVAGTFRDREDLAALQALCDVLCGDNEAPLRRRLLDSGLAEDVTMRLDDGIQQPTLLVTVKNCSRDRLAEVEALLQSELQRLVREGLDHRRVQATLDNLEFSLRERQGGWMPQGLLLATQIYASWLYGGDPAANLPVEPLLRQLRRDCDEGRFEQRIRRVLLENPHRCRVILRPSHTLGAERAGREAGRIRAVTDAWDEADWARARAEQERIEAWQTTPDAPEALASIPRLRPGAIDPRPEPLPTREETLAGLPVLCHPLPTHGITYLNLYFAAEDLTGEELSQAAFLCELLGALETDDTPAALLPQRLRACFGSLQNRVEAYGDTEDYARCRVFFCMSASLLNDKAAMGADLLCELLQKTRMDGREKLWEILRQRRAELAQGIARNGSAYAVTRAGAAFRTECAVQEYAGGIAFLQWLEAREAEGPDALPALAARLRGLTARLFTRARLTVSVTSDGDTAGTVAGRLAAALPAGEGPCPAPCAVTWPAPAREGFVLPADVAFAAMSGPFPDANRGDARVMKRVVSLDCLWNAVRVRGGAYGTGMALRNNGLAGFSSYRDPNAARTLGCFRQIPDFLREYAGDVEGAVLGAIGESAPLLTPRDKGKTADARHWKHLTDEALYRTRQEMLATTTRDVAGYAARMRQLTAGSAVCVLGPRSQLEACGSELDTILSL